VRAQLVVEVGQARLGRGHLELAQADVVEVLRRAYDRVDDRADEGEQRGGRGAPDQHRVVDAPAGVGVRPEDERGPDHDEDEDQHGHGLVEAVVGDPEDAEGEHAVRKRTRGAYRNARPKA
jgi:hypothetical protein